MPAGGSCLLGSLNLSAFVNDENEFDYVSFREAIKIAVIALNEVLDEGLKLHPLKEQQDSVRDWRQIGLGIFGLADMLIKMECEYGSEESLMICDKIAHTLIDTAIMQSAILSNTRGCFPKYKYNYIYPCEFYKKNTSDQTKEMVRKYGLANSQLLTIAPTGSKKIIGSV